MATQPNLLNRLVEHPDFDSLSDDEKRNLFKSVQGSQPPRGAGSEAQGGSRTALPLGVSMMGASNQGTDYSPAIDASRPFIAQAAGAGVGALASPAGPVAAGAADVGTYSVVDALMQYLKKEKPASFGSALEEGAANAVGNKILGGLAGIVGRGAKAVLNSDVPDAKSILNFSPTSSQALKATGSPILGTVAKTFEDLALTSKEKALDRSAGAGFTQALKTAKAGGFDLTQDATTGQFKNPLNPQAHLTSVNQALSPASEGPVFSDLASLNKVIRDPQKLQDVLSTAQENGIDTNVRKSLQQYQFAKLFNNATTRDVAAQGPQKVVRIDPNTFNSDWLDPEMQDSLKKLYSAKQRSDITQFFQNVAATQDKVQANPIARKFWMMHAGIGLGTGLLTGSLTGGAMGALTSGGVLVGAEGLGKLLTNPKTARLLVSLAGGEPLGVSEAYAGRQIVNALQGSTIAILNADGTKTPARIQGEKLVPLGQ
jgi:hypothetical protein